MNMDQTQKKRAMERQSKQSQQPDKKASSGSVLRQLMYGQIVSSDFFARNWMAMLLVVVMILVYIAGKYTCQTKMEQVRSLQRELETVRTERIRARSDYMGRIRESAMQEMVDTLHLGLCVREYPPYIVEAEEQ